MNIITLLEAIDTVIVLHDKHDDYYQLEKVDGKFGIKIYQFQYFWQLAAKKEDYLRKLLKYRQGALFRYIFDLKYLHKGKLQSSYHEKVDVLKKVVKFLIKTSPEILISAIKISSNFLRDDYYIINEILKDSQNPEIESFTKIENVIRKNIKSKKNQIQILLKESLKHPTIQILCHLLDNIENYLRENEKDLDYTIEAANQLFYHLLKNGSSLNSSLESQKQKPLLALTNDLLKLKIDQIKFNRDCVEVFRFDNNARLSIVDDTKIDIDYSHIDQHEIWRRNGDKYNLLHEYYWNKSNFLALNENSVTPFDIEYGQAILYYQDLGISKYDFKGFNIEELTAIVFGLKHIEKWRENLLTVDKKEGFVETLYNLFKQKIHREKIDKIVQWLTYTNEYLHFGIKVFFKYSDKLILPSALLQRINYFVPITNYIFKPTKNNFISKEVAFNQADNLLNEFKSNIPKLEWLIEEELPYGENGESQGELDLAIYDGNEILIIELKGSSVRTNLKDRKNLLDTTINKANHQLKKLRYKFKQGNKQYDWLIKSLKVEPRTKPKINYIIATTSFEWDNLAEMDFFKCSYFTLLLRLRKATWFYNLDWTEEYFAITKLDKKDLQKEEVLNRIRNFEIAFKITQQPLSIKSFLDDLYNNKYSDRL